MNKSITDIIDGAPQAPGRKGKMAKNKKKVEHINGEEAKSYMQMTVAELGKEIVKIEDSMHKAARDLKFEEAAAMRDQLVELKDLLKSR